jgi:hypothetical protein
MNDIPKVTAAFPIDHVKEALDMLCGCVGVPPKDFHSTVVIVVAGNLGLIRDQSFGALILISGNNDSGLAIEILLRGTKGFEAVCIA